MALRVRVCRVDEVPAEDFRAFPVNGVTWPVIVARVDGELVAVPGVCPHEDVALEHGYMDGPRIVCPGHSYGFDLRTGRCQHDATLVLRRYKLSIIDDDVWVDLL